MIERLYTTVGSPEGAVIAAPGDICIASDGSIYLKGQGNEATGWALLPPNITAGSGIAITSSGDAITIATTGGVVNVKDFGAKGDTRTVDDAATTYGSGLVSSATASFASSDLGKTIFAVKSDGSAPLPRGTIAAVVSATQVLVSVPAVADGTGNTLVWGTPDGAAIQAAVAFIAQRKSTSTYQSTLYFPSGGYLSEIAPMITIPANANGFRVVGEGVGQTVFFLVPDVVLAAGSQGQFISCPNSGNYISLENFTIDGTWRIFSNDTGNAFAVFFSGGSNLKIDRVLIQRWIAGPGDGNNYALYLNSCSHINMTQVQTLQNSTGMRLNAVSDFSWHACVTSNNAITNLIVSNCSDEGLGGNVNLFGGLVDESAGDISASISDCANAVRLHGTTFYARNAGSNPSTALKIVNSTVRAMGIFAGQYNSGGANATGVSLDATSTLYLSNSHLTGTATGVGLQVAGGGSYVDGGANLISP